VKVVLVEPPSLTLRPGAASLQVHPLGLGYLAAALRPDHDVRQFVPDLKPNPDGADRVRETAEAIGDAEPDVVGISALSTTILTARRIAALCREGLGEGVPLVLGGLHATLEPDGAPEFDRVVVGEGERTLRELVDAIESGRDPSGVPGLAGSGAARPPVVDLDTLAFPHREDLLWEQHVQPAFYQSIITIRGCPYRCEYCSIPSVRGGHARFRSPGNIADEIALLRKRYDVPYLMFHDSVFTLSRKRSFALAELLLSRDLAIPYTCQTRIDRVDGELLFAMRAAGCEQIYFGIESGDPETLRRIRKDNPPERVRETVKAVRALGIRASGYFMIGFPWETREHMERTAEFAMDLELDSLCLFSATPLPGSGLWVTAGAPPLPEGMDYRQPGAHANFTSLSDAEYADLYRSVWDRFDAYNLNRMPGRSDTRR
jgi:radical SAM superfamily enzyme YgiQ (UPF0313 family)